MPLSERSSCGRSCGRGHGAERRERDSREPKARARVEDGEPDDDDPHDPEEVRAPARRDDRGQAGDPEEPRRCADREGAEEDGRSRRRAGRERVDLDRLREAAGEEERRGTEEGRPAVGIGATGRAVRQAECPREADPGETMMSLRRWLISRYDFTGIARQFFRSRKTEILFVIGYNLVPAPPASIIPFIIFIVLSYF